MQLHREGAQSVALCAPADHTGGLEAGWNEDAQKNKQSG